MNRNALSGKIRGEIGDAGGATNSDRRLTEVARIDSTEGANHG